MKRPWYEYWTVLHRPAAATKATITKAAETGKRHVCVAVHCTIACDATAQTPIAAILYDGSTEKWAALIAAPANGQGGAALKTEPISGTPNTAMKLEFEAAGVASSKQCVVMQGYTIQNQ